MFMNTINDTTQTTVLIRKTSHINMLTETCLNTIALRQQL